MRISALAAALLRPQLAESAAPRRAMARDPRPDRGRPRTLAACPPAATPAGGGLRAHLRAVLAARADGPEIAAVLALARHGACRSNGSGPVGRPVSPARRAIGATRGEQARARRDGAGAVDAVRHPHARVAGRRGMRPRRRHPARGHRRRARRRPADSVRPGGLATARPSNKQSREERNEDHAYRTRRRRALAAPWQRRPAQTPIGVSYQPSLYWALPFHYATVKGWWKDVGLTPDLHDLPGRRAADRGRGRQVVGRRRHGLGAGDARRGAVQHRHHRHHQRRVEGERHDGPRRQVRRR